MIDLTCSDTLHATRAAQPGWAAVLGQGDTPNTGLLCPACAAAVTQIAAAKRADQQAFAVARKAALENLQTASSNWLKLDASQKDAAFGLMAALMLATGESAPTTALTAQLQDSSAALATANTVNPIPLPPSPVVPSPVVST